MLNNKYIGTINNLIMHATFYLETQGSMNELGKFGFHILYKHGT